MLSAFKKTHFLKAAIKQTKNARASEGTKAEQLFLSAYDGYAEVVKNDITLVEALYNWGFALLHHAKSTEKKKSLALYKEAIEKFGFCLIIEPNHLGAAIDGGVCYMELAQLNQVDRNNELYALANKAFNNAERIQRGSASYNLACINAIQGNDEGCLKKLQASLTYGSLPDYEEIIGDKDLDRVIKKKWFIDFINKLGIELEIGNKDEKEMGYDEEGKVKKNVGKDLRRFPEIERDGKVYGVEGNVIRIIKKDTLANVGAVKKEITECKVESKSIRNKSVKYVGVALKTGFNDVEK